MISMTNVYPAPSGVQASTRYAVSVDNRPSFTYLTTGPAEAVVHCRPHRLVDQFRCARPVRSPDLPLRQASLRGGGEAVVGQG